MPHAILYAGYSTRSSTLFHRTRFLVGDAQVLIELDRGGRRESTLIIRDIEAGRARRSVRADAVVTPGELVPAAELSPDRETQFVQAAAAFLTRAGVTVAVGDRTMPLSFVDAIQKAGIRVEYDPELGVATRRRKTAEELDRLREAQAATESAMEMACRTIARATAGKGGVLMHENEPLTSDRVRWMIDVHLLKHGYDNPPSIVACGEACGDCHDHGHGELRTGETVIVDIFPKSKTHLYCGDSTRVVVHGAARPEAVAMHRAVVGAKKASEAASRTGARVGTVNAASEAVLRGHGFERGFPGPGAPATTITFQHGTGHGIGLDGHEAPLVDGAEGTGPELVEGDVVTLEPGLYSRRLGGVRIEDMVVVRAGGCENLGRGLHEGLDWR